MAPPVKVDPEQLEAYAKRFDATMSPHLAKLKNLVDQVNGVESAFFTTVTIPLAAIYTEATNYTQDDIQGKTDDLGTIVDTLNQTARQWTQTEHTNTVGK
jgi:hypothetical protein